MSNNASLPGWSTRAVFLASVLIGNALAQTFSGTITGVVTDPSGGAVPGATVALTNVITREVRSVTTDESGRYTFSRLLPSTYEIKVAHQGFQTYERSGIQLSTNQALEVNLQLVVGSVTEAMRVMANAEMVDTQNANRSMTLTSEIVRQLPLNARDALALVHTSAGVVSARTGVPGVTPDQNTNRFSLNGGRHETTAVLVDGIPMGSGQWGGLIASPGVEAVQEMQVVRNTYDAEFGRTGGGVINITTRGGGPEYHGGIFDYYRNDNMDANSFFNNRAGRPLSEYKRNQFGGSIGGPIWKSKKLFGFFAYEGLRTGAPASRLSTVPTALQLQGDFSETRNRDGSLAVIYDPTTTTLDPAQPGKYMRRPFPGNVIPQSRFDPVALNVLKLFPKPNQPGDPITGVNNWYGAGSSSTAYNRYDARVDWARSERHTMFARFTIGRQNDNPAILFDRPAETSYYARNPREQLSWGNTFIFSPTFVVNTLVGGGRWSEIDLSPAAGYDSTTLGLPSSLVSQFDVAAPPVINVGDYTSLSYNRYLNNVQNVLSLQAGATKELGSHSIKFGWSYQLMQINGTDVNGPNFNFDRYFTSGPDPDARIATAGNSIASLLLGTGSGGGLPIRIRPAVTDPYHGFYIQDTWRVNRKLTVNYGLRYEIQQGRTERYNRLARLDLSVPNPIGAQIGRPDLKGGLVYVTPQNRTQWDSGFNYFAPRVGIAYRISDKLVARTGYGIFYDRVNYPGATTGTDGFSQTTPWTTSLDGGRTPYAYLRNPFPDGLLPITGSSAGALTNVGQGVGGVLKSLRASYIQQYSFDLQYQLGSDVLIEAGYTGTQGRKLLYGSYGFQFDQLPDSLLALGNQLLQQVPNPFYGLISSGPLSGPTVQYGQLLRPYPQFNGVTASFMPGASSSYNALVTHVQKRFSHGVTLDLSYQFSKAIDNASEQGSPGLVDAARDFNNLSLERSISSHDVPHSFAAAFMADLPFGKGRALGGAWPKWLNAALGGWGVSGIYRLASGLPSHFTAPNNTNSFGGSQQPNVTNMKDVPVDNPSTYRWFNTSAFSQPAAFTFGNAPRWFTNVRFSRSNNLDAALLKNFQATERIKAQFRAEFFNALNRTQFGWPDTNIASNTFGQNNGTAPGFTPRNIQLGLRFDF
jgi:hypothetical protein